MIYKTDNGYVISSGGLWLSGVYDTKQAARYAFQFSDDVLFKLCEQINKIEKRNITTDDLKQTRADDE